MVVKWIWYVASVSVFMILLLNIGTLFTMWYLFILIIIQKWNICIQNKSNFCKMIECFFFINTLSLCKAFSTESDTYLYCSLYLRLHITQQSTTYGWHWIQYRLNGNNITVWTYCGIPLYIYWLITCTKLIISLNVIKYTTWIYQIFKFSLIFNT